MVDSLHYSVETGEEMVGIVPCVVCSLVDEGAVDVFGLGFRIGEFLVDLVSDELVRLSSHLFLLVAVESGNEELDLFEYAGL